MHGARICEQSNKSMSMRIEEGKISVQRGRDLGTVIIEGKTAGLYTIRESYHG